MFSNWNFEFHTPGALLLFLLFLPLAWRDFRKQSVRAIAVPTLKGMVASTHYYWVALFLKSTKYVVLSLLIVALARPRTFTVSHLQDDGHGIDIMLTVDVSLSMLSRDLDPDRLTALQGIAVDFVKGRPADRIGLVTYSGEALTKVPVTTDHQVVIDEIIGIDPLELTPGTAIGEGLAVAVSHLRHSKAKSKIIILMTDGVNTVENAMPPQVAAELAYSEEIKVYTIGIGTNGYALMPTSLDPFGGYIFTETEVHIDEATLQEIAMKTGGKYYRATSNDKLQRIYQEINELEKSKIKSSTFYNYKEYFMPFIVMALGLLILDAFFRWVLFKTLK